MFLTLLTEYVYLLALTGTVSSFGTLDEGGQHLEHQFITRAALGCGPGTSGPSDCFETISVIQIAGQKRSSGAVGSPDADEVLSAVAHCDDADFLDFAKYGIPGKYDRTRDQANQALQDCIAHLSGRFLDGISKAKGMLDSKDNIVKKQTDVLIDGGCTFVGGFGGRAKCSALEGFGRALHGIQDFYSHSNYVDNGDPSKPVSVTNPPGVHGSAPAPFLDLRSAMSPAGFTVPPDLSTGCFIVGLPPDKSGARDCVKAGRITHVTLNKDTGTIAEKDGPAIPPTPLLTKNPTTPRGQITASNNNNFELAVENAILETRRQWADFRAALQSEYGPKKASIMICALTKDFPWKDCTGKKIALVIDSSGSNQDTDPSNLRIAAADSFRSTLVTAADAAGAEDTYADEVAVISFTTSASVIYPLGDPAKARFDGIGADGGTFIAGGISLGIDELTKASGPDAPDASDPAPDTQEKSGIIVFTDGQDSDTSALLAAIDRAGGLGMRVSFGFLSPPSNPVARRSRRGRRDINASPPLLSPSSSSSSALTKRQDSGSPPTDLITSILQTGGSFSTIDSAAAQKSFIDVVIARGATNILGTGSSYGGPLFPGVKVYGLTSTNTTGNPTRFNHVATPGNTLTFEVRVLAGPPGMVLEVSLHNKDGRNDVVTVQTDGKGVATLVYKVEKEVELELDVAAAAAAGAGATTNTTTAAPAAPAAPAPTNETGLFSVELKIEAPPSQPPTGADTCGIKPGETCGRVGEMKCCGTGGAFITCDFSGYVVRECGPGTVCKGGDDGGDGVYCGWP